MVQPFVSLLSSQLSKASKLVQMSVSTFSDDSGEGTHIQTPELALTPPSAAHRSLSEPPIWIYAPPSNSAHCTALPFRANLEHQRSNPDIFTPPPNTHPLKRLKTACFRDAVISVAVAPPGRNDLRSPRFQGQGTPKQCPRMLHSTNHVACARAPFKRPHCVPPTQVLPCMRASK